VVLGALAIAALAEARPALVKDRARLREGPSTQSEFLVWLDPGTRVEVLEERDGWMRVQAAGREGYVWGEHTAPADVELAKASEVVASPPATPAAAAAPTSLADEVRALRADVNALRERAEGTGGDGELARLKAEVDRLAAAQRDLAHRMDDRPVVVPPADPAGEGGSGGGSLVLLLAMGALLGWGVSRFAQRGRDRRQRNRLRF
jgi:hypothetical protein